MNRRRKKNKKNIVEWFKELSIPKKILLCVGIIFLLILLIIIFYLSHLFSKLNTEEIPEEDLFINEEVEDMMNESDFGDGYTNFVLFGGDSRTGEVDKDLNTDVIMIVSLNNTTKEIKLVSVYRDTLLDVTTGYLQKCNSAYSGGGPTRAINMLNMNLDMNIKKYVTVDFGAVAEVIDMLGGIDVEVSENEMNAMNKYIKETARVAGKKAVLIKEPGYQHLDGVQATTYARIRKGVGDDYQRTERQRLVIKLVAEKVLKSDWGTINKIINKVLPTISTNLTSSEILLYAKNFAFYEIGDSSGFPFEKGSKTIPGKGSCVYAISLAENVSELHKFLFGTEAYEPSSTVNEISNKVDSLVNSSSSWQGYSNDYEDEPDDEPTYQEPDTPTDPGTTDSGTTDPGTTDPGATDPGTTDPGATDPGTTDPGTAGSGTTGEGIANTGEIVE